PQNEDMLHARLCVVFPALAGCSSSGTASPPDASTFPAEALSSVSTDSGKLRIDIRTGPQQPPTRGNQSVELVVVNATTGAPEPGLMLSVVPWMPVMGHGTSLTPSVTETSPGTYVITNVGFFMPGTWELRTSIAGSTSDHTAPSFEIP
ncbi:MAG: FixH family protein, partial [Polyangiaceae bacterium]